MLRRTKRSAAARAVAVTLIGTLIWIFGPYQVAKAAASWAQAPLLVLGGLALALLAAGGTGYVARRRRAGSGHDVNDDDLS